MRIAGRIARRIARKSPDLKNDRYPSGDFPSEDKSGIESFRHCCIGRNVII